MDIASIPVLPSLGWPCLQCDSRDAGDGSVGLPCLVQNTIVSSIGWTVLIFQTFMATRRRTIMSLHLISTNILLLHGVGVSSYLFVVGIKCISLFIYILIIFTRLVFFTAGAFTADIWVSSSVFTLKSLKQVLTQRPQQSESGSETCMSHGDFDILDIFFKSKWYPESLRHDSLVLSLPHAVILLFNKMDYRSPFPSFLIEMKLASSKARICGRGYWAAEQWYWISAHTPTHQIVNRA